MEESGKPVEPPESLQKGLLQLLWSTRPWIRNSLLILAGAIALVYTVVPESVRDAAMLSLFGMNQAPAKGSNDGENDTVTPAGAPEADNATDSEDPDTTPVATDTLPDDPA